MLRECLQLRYSSAQQMFLPCEEGADELFSQRQILSLFFNESTRVQSQLREP